MNDQKSLLGSNLWYIEIELNGQRRMIAHSDGKARGFETREKARQFIRNRFFEQTRIVMFITSKLRYRCV